MRSICSVAPALFHYALELESNGHAIMCENVIIGGNFKFNQRYYPERVYF